MTVNSLISRLNKLVKENSDLGESEIVFNLPTNHDEGALYVAEYNSDTDMWDEEAYVGLPEFVKGPMG